MSGVLIPFAKISSIFEASNDAPLWIVVNGPTPSETNVALDEPIVVRAVLPDDDPSVTDPSVLSLVVQVDRGAGWETIYNGSTFTPPWDVSSSVSGSTATSPYVWKEVSCIPSSDVFQNDTDILVRVFATTDAGWGYFEWAHEEWGYPSDGYTIDEEFTFKTIDQTAPEVVLVEAVGRETIRVTYSEPMAPHTADGHAIVNATVNQSAWPDSGSLPWVFNVVVDGETHSVTIDSSMVSGTEITAEELTFSLSALVDGVSAVHDGGIVSFLTSSVGDSATLQFTGGNGVSLLGIPLTEARGAFKGVLDDLNYSVERKNTYPNPAVNLEIVSAAFDTDSESVVNLTTQWPMTPDAPYELSIDGDVTDVSGNIVKQSTLVHGFQGFRPEWDSRRDTSINLPKVIWDHDDEAVMLAIVNIWREFQDQFIADCDEVWDMFSPDNAPSYLLPVLLEDMGNPFIWSELELDESEQRKLLSLLPSIYELKGVAPGIESAIYLLLDIPVEIEPHNSDGWRLGVDVLGDSYPATVRSGNVEPFDLSGGGILTVVVNDGAPQNITFEDEDFEDSSIATADEVSAVVAGQLIGGGAQAADDSSGPRVVIYSSHYGPGGKIQVTGGTINTALAFDTTVHSSSGGCRLATGDERALRTFDLVYGDVVPSAEQIVLMRKIAEYMKFAHEFVGNIRPEKVFVASDRWELGRSTLGVSTVVG